MKYRTYLLFGPPGAGKGTLGKVLGTIPRFRHVACGDVFRALDTRTPLGQSFLSYSSKGQLVPDELTIELWKARIKDEVEAHTFKPDLDALVLDGIPRNVNQARLMQSMIDVVKVFSLEVPDVKELTERIRKRALKENRYDDANETIIRKRLDVFENESRPLIEFYGDGLVQRINAAQPPVKVLYDLLGAVIVGE